MSLSNTATPIYYGRFRDAVLRQEIPVNREISKEMNRIDRMIEDPNYYYDDRAIKGFIAYCEKELTLADGGDLVLLESFKLWAESLLSWFIFEERNVYSHKTKTFTKRLVKKRIRRQQYLIVARGAAKSMYASCLQSYFLNVDPSTTKQITVAPTMKQAEEVMNPIRTSIVRSRGPMFKFLTMGSINNTTGSMANRQMLASTKIGIQNFMNGSSLEIRPMSMDKVQGLQPKFASIDEWLSGETREDVIGAIDQGASKNREYAVLAISSEGTVRGGIGDSVKIELNKILEGDTESPHISIWHYKLDHEDEIAYPELWIKANPNLGITVSYETYALDVEKMENNPSAENDIKAKRFGLPMQGFTFFFQYEETIPHEGNYSFEGMTCAMGADLSQGDDFCAFTFLFPLPNGTFGIKARSYITQNTLDRLHPARRDDYDQFIREGTLQIMEGVTLDMGEVTEDLLIHIRRNNYDVRAMGYDPYNSYKFLELWTNEYGPFAVVKVAQGARTESVPLGEIKKYMELRQMIFTEMIMYFTMKHSVVLFDTNNNKKLSKNRQDQKIDNVAALMDAYVAFGVHKEAF